MIFCQRNKKQEDLDVRFPTSITCEEFMVYVVMQISVFYNFYVPINGDPILCCASIFKFDMLVVTITSLILKAIKDVFQALAPNLSSSLFIFLRLFVYIFSGFKK